MIAIGDVALRRLLAGLRPSSHAAETISPQLVLEGVMLGRQAIANKLIATAAALGEAEHTVAQSMIFQLSKENSRAAPSLYDLLELREPAKNIAS